MGRHNRELPPPWHCTWDPILEVFVEIEPEDLTVYDQLVEQTEKDSPSEEHDDSEPILSQEPGSVIE